MKNSSYTLSQLLSDIKSDLSRKSGSSIFWAAYYLLFSPQMRVLFYYRIAHWFYRNGHPRCAYALKSFQSGYGCYISERSIIGKSLCLPHPVGVVIGEGVVIEDNVSIWQHVTIGSHGKSDAPQKYPYVAQGVKIFAGAVIIGNLKIGENSVVGANAVVLSDVKPNAVAVGVPYKG